MISIVFGCGRLTAGPSFKDSANIVAACLAGGIRHFDVAPSYGVGTAEDVLGRTLAGRPDVLITTKVGSKRPAMGALKAHLRYAKRQVGLSRRDNRNGFSPSEPRLDDPDNFADLRLRASLTQSLKRLRRSCVHRLLLHEVPTHRVDSGMLKFLQEMQSDGTCELIGYSNSQFFEPSALPPSVEAQCALPPDVLLSTRSEYCRGVTFHSVLRVVAWLRGADYNFADALDQTVAHFADLELSEASTVVSYAIATQGAPSARLIYATTNAARLEGFLNGLRKIDDLGLAEEINLVFRRNLVARQSDK